YSGGAEEAQALEQNPAKLVLDVAAAVEDEHARQHPDPHRHQRNDCQTNSDPKGGGGFSLADRADAQLEALIEQVRERLVDGEKEGAQEVGAGVPAKLGEQAG